MFFYEHFTSQGRAKDHLIRSEFTRDMLCHSNSLVRSKKKVVIEYPMCTEPATLRENVTFSFNGDKYFIYVYIMAIVINKCVSFFCE